MVRGEKIQLNHQVDTPYHEPACLDQLRMIEAVLASFQRVEGLADCPLIIVCDGALTWRERCEVNQVGEKSLVGFLLFIVLSVI